MIDEWFASIVIRAQRPALPAKPARVIPLTEAMNAISASKVEPKK